MTVEWLNPAALALLAAVAGPLLVHLLLRQRAVRVRFPSLRFITGASTAAVRPRAPSDRLLLLLRAAIVAAAAVAVAAPVFITPGRRAAWDSRLSRAVVLDTSPSMADAAARSIEAAAAERRGATHAIAIEARDLRDGVARGVEELRRAPSSRREIVVVSDLHNGSLTAADVQRVPASYGLTFVDVGRLRPARRIRGGQTLGAGDVAATEEIVALAGRSTAVSFLPAAASLDGLSIQGDTRHVAGLLRIVAGAGAPAPSLDEPMAVVFAAVPIGSRVSPWMTRAVLEMRRDERLTAAAREHRASHHAAAPGAPWVVIARGAAGDPVVLGGARGGELTILVRGGPEDFVTAAAVHAALLARRRGTEWTEHEIEGIPAAARAAWSRAPQPFVPSREELQTQGETDSRLLWLLALGLLAAESIVRRRPEQGAQEPYADAA